MIVLEQATQSLMGAHGTFQLRRRAADKLIPDPLVASLFMVVRSDLTERTKRSACEFMFGAWHAVSRISTPGSPRRICAESL